MANVLLLTSNLGPAEGGIASALTSAGHTVQIYSASGSWLTPGPVMPLWMKGYRTRLSSMAKNLFTQQIADLHIDHVIASGLEACAFAASNIEQRYIPLLWSEDLNFTSSRRTQVDYARRLFSTTEAVFLENDWEMDKALSFGSTVSHLRLPVPAGTGQRLLTGHRNIALIYPPSMQPEAVEAALQRVAEACGDEVAVSPVEIGSFFRSTDVQRRRDFYDIMSYRIRDYSHAVILGSGPHHSTMLAALQPDRDRVVVDRTIGNAFTIDRLGYEHAARGLRLFAMLPEMLQETERPAPPTPAPTSDLLQDLLSSLEDARGQVTEQLDSDTGSGPLNVFFAAAPLEDRVNAARPQRIRNMHDAVRHQGDCVVVNSTEMNLRRRLQRVLNELAAGRQPGFFYGENSTTPMDPATCQQLCEFLHTFRDHGGKAAWFVRDFYWLEDRDDVDSDEWMRMRREGLAELRQIESNVDVLAAPSETTGVGYNDLLQRHDEPPRTWFPLSPAVAPDNVVPEGIYHLDDTKTTLLYAGGFGWVYPMDTYLSALEQLDDSYLIDFVVREGEHEPLAHALQQRQLFVGDRVRILHTTLAQYQPRTSRCIGTDLLDGEYATMGFQYKTVSMLERGFPMLCFKGMGIAPFVEEHQVGLAVERTTEAVVAGIKTLAAHGAPGLVSAQAEQTWDTRVASLLAAFKA